MHAATGAGLGLAPTSTTLTNLGYLRERDAAAALPWLSIRRPLHSVTLLRTSRRWALGFAMEASGFLLYATALGLALLTLVQSIAAGEVAVLGAARAVPSGSLGDLRALAFVAVSAGASCWRSPTIRAQRAGSWAGVTSARRSSHAA